MAKQTINIGSGENQGDGDPLRSAFTKINENFSEVYAGPPQYTQTEINELTASNGLFVYNTTTGKFQGYVPDSGLGSPGWIDLH